MHVKLVRAYSYAHAHAHAHAHYLPEEAYVVMASIVWPSPARGGGVLSAPPRREIRRDRRVLRLCGVVDRAVHAGPRRARLGAIARAVALAGAAARCRR